MNSGNHHVDAYERYLDAQDWQCPACGSRRDPEDTGYCGNFCGECTEACPDCIEAHQDDAGRFMRAFNAVLAFFDLNPYKNIHINCAEYYDAVRCDSCGHVERL